MQNFLYLLWDILDSAVQVGILLVIVRLARVIKNK